MNNKKEEETRKDIEKIQKLEKRIKEGDIHLIPRYKEICKKHGLWNRSTKKMLRI